MAGIFLPLLPTTPFLLLAAACFIRSSDRLYNWLLNHRLFGNYIRNYREHKAIPLKAKIVTLLTLWITLIVSAILLDGGILIIFILAAVGVGVTFHVSRFKTLEENKNMTDMDGD
ncbi:YbaN family protein [Bacteroidota bacterium]